MLGLFVVTGCFLRYKFTPLFYVHSSVKIETHGSHYYCALASIWSNKVNHAMATYFDDFSTQIDNIPSFCTLGLSHFLTNRASVDGLCENSL